MTCSNMGNLREFSTGTTYEAGGRIQGNYKEMAQNPRVKGDITCKPKELIAGSRRQKPQEESAGEDREGCQRTKPTSGNILGRE